MGFVTSAGNAIMHDATSSEMPGNAITMFYVDGDRLLLTHYSDPGNWPRMEAKISPDGKSVDFSFLDDWREVSHRPHQDGKSPPQFWFLAHACRPLLVFSPAANSWRDYTQFYHQFPPGDMQLPLRWFQNGCHSGMTSWAVLYRKTLVDLAIPERKFNPTRLKAKANAFRYIHWTTLATAIIWS